MKNALFLSAAFALLAAAPAYAREGHSPAAARDHASTCGLPTGEGTVTAINVKASEATINHGPIAALGWDAMTMDFKAAKGVDLSAFAAGDTVHFLLTEDRKSKSYRIEAICALNVSDGLHDACMGKMHETAMTLAENSGKSCKMEDMDHAAMKGMDHGSMKGMDHGAMPGMVPAEPAEAAEKPAAAAPDHSQH